MTSGPVPARVAVIDIGKTNAKLALVDMESLRDIAVLTRPNRVLDGPPWPRFDLEGHRAFLLAGLADLHRRHGIDAISVTTHGASAVLLDARGGLAAPMLDYEHPGPDAAAAAYDALRPDFAETGSPRLPGGLNLGAQLHWQFLADPDLAARVGRVLTYPQYWGHWLTGEAACDLCSLGCHTDLWNPWARRFSSLAERLDIAGRIAPPRRPDGVLGLVRPAIARAAGLPAATPVAVGIHDSNASLLPHLMVRRAPFSVVSTGTWVVAMAVGGATVTLDEGRDMLVNVNALGDPVPSARFMGGREHALIQPQGGPAPDEGDMAAVLARGIMLLPAVVPGSGPYPGRRARWTGPNGTEDGAEPQGAARAVALGFYLALMTAECLRLCGHRGDVVVEGPFAANAPYRAMLAAATGSPVIAGGMGGSITGTSQGAALLVHPGAAGALRAADGPATLPGDPALAAYAQAWAARVRP